MMELVNKMSLQLETITPLWMGGAAFQPEFRPPSFRGLLRYWLRALLGCALAFLHARAKGRTNSPDYVLVNQIERHLTETRPVRSGDLRSLTSFDSRVYFQATQQTHVFLSELMAFVEKFT